jgi:hypothetical protein
MDRFGAGTVNFAKHRVEWRGDEYSDVTALSNRGSGIAGVMNNGTIIAIFGLSIVIKNLAGERWSKPTRVTNPAQTAQSL